MLNRGSCEIRLAKAFRVLDILSRHPDLAQHFGMSDPQDPELARGWTLYHGAKAAHHQRTIREADALCAADHCAAVFARTRAAQTRLTALARVMIKTPSDRDRLGITGRRAEALGAWCIQAQLFHANLNTEDRTQLARVGVTQAELDQTHAAIGQLKDHHAARVAAQAEARAATQAKKDAFAALADFLSLIINITRALEPDHPHLATLLGMRRDQRRRIPTNEDTDQDQPTDPAKPQTRMHDKDNTMGLPTKTLDPTQPAKAQPPDTRLKRRDKNQRRHQRRNKQHRRAHR